MQCQIVSTQKKSGEKKSECTKGKTESFWSEKDTIFSNPPFPGDTQTGSYVKWKWWEKWDKSFSLFSCKISLFVHLSRVKGRIADKLHSAGACLNKEHSILTFVWFDLTTCMMKKYVQLKRDTKLLRFAGPIMGCGFVRVLQFVGCCFLCIIPAQHTAIGHVTGWLILQHTLHQYLWCLFKIPTKVFAWISLSNYLTSRLLMKHSGII